MVLVEWGQFLIGSLVQTVITEVAPRGRRILHRLMRALIDSAVSTAALAALVALAILGARAIEPDAGNPVDGSHPTVRGVGHGLDLRGSHGFSIPKTPAALKGKPPVYVPRPRLKSRHFGL